MCFKPMDILNPLPADVRCPCGTGLTFGECCKKYHDGTPAPTAETLMRSRFSAFVTGDEAYLLRTWDPATRPDSLNFEEIFAAEHGVRFYRLDIVDTVRSEERRVGKVGRARSEQSSVGRKR